MQRLAVIVGRPGAALSICTTLTLAAGGAQASPLSDLAATLEPGDWAELATDNLTAVLAETQGIGATGSILPYSEDGVWDGGSGRFYFIGSDHIYDGTSSGPRFVAYDEESNAWQVLPDPPWFGAGTMHGYDHSAVLDGRLYHMTLTVGDPLREYDIAGTTWTARAQFNEGSYNHYGALEPFPALGGLIYAEGGGVYLWERAADQWSTLASGVAMGDYHNFAEYNPVHELVLLGGGNDSGLIHVLADDRSLTAGTDAPFPLRVNQAVVTVDPLSGDFLVFGGTGEFYAYDPTTDEWRLQDPPAPFFPGGQGPVELTIAGPVDSYGVVLFVKHTDPGDTPEAQVWIYKHAPGQGTGRPDAGADAGVDAGESDAGGQLPNTPPSEDSGGCGCRVERAGRSVDSAMVVSLLIGLLLFARSASRSRGR